MNWRFAVTHAYKERRGWGRVRERAGEGGKKKGETRTEREEKRKETGKNVWSERDITTRRR